MLTFKYGQKLSCRIIYCFRNGDVSAVNDARRPTTELSVNNKL